MSGDLDCACVRVVAGGLEFRRVPAVPAAPAVLGRLYPQGGAGWDVEVRCRDCGRTDLVGRVIEAQARREREPADTVGGC